MCSIIAIISNIKLYSDILSGLQKLEYRGYDSAGLALLNNKMQCFKIVGNVKKLINHLDENKADTIQTKLGIGHTRWATHGKPTINNAHPHIYKNICIVHNGIIENYVKLKNQLQKLYKFQSDSDSEVIAVLAYHLLKNEANGNLIILAKLLFMQLQGSFAIVLHDLNNKDQLLAMTNNSPLAIAQGNDKVAIASDSIAFSEQFQSVFYLEDRQFVICTQQQIQLFDNQANVLHKNFIILKHTLNIVSLKSYNHFMLKEIYEQKNIISDLANTYKTKLQQMNISLSFSSKIHRIHIVACGSSYHVALLAQKYFAIINNLACEVFIASEYRYQTNIIAENTVLIVISQSGETADTLEALKLAKRQLSYINIIAVTNSKYSSISRLADILIFADAGKEIGVASTKAFTTQVFYMLLLALKLKIINEQTEQSIIKNLATLTDKISVTLALNDEIYNLAKIIALHKNCLFLARGNLLPVAHEASLKLKELSYIHAEAIAAGELKHGHLALVDKKMLIIFFITNDNLLAKILSNIREVQAREGQIIIFYTDDIVLPIDLQNLSNIKLVNSNQFYNPFVFAIALQLLAYNTALILEYNIDQPRNLAKSVTVE